MRSTWLFVTLLAMAVWPAGAQDHAEHGTARSGDRSAAGRIPPPAEQVAAALMAAPEEFRDGARVLGYSPAGKLVELRKGTGEMVCLADDPAEASRWHVACYHVSLEPFMARGRELTAQGITGMRRDSTRNADVVAGRVRMPAAGALYTLTARAGCFDAAAGTLCDHVNAVHSVYVPNATTASTGLPDHPVDAHTPFLMSPGTPRAHIMFGTHEH